MFVPPPPSSHWPQIFDATTLILRIEACGCVSLLLPVCLCAHSGGLAFTCEVKLKRREESSLFTTQTSDSGCAPASSRYIIIRCLTRGDTEPTKQRGGQAPAVNGAWLCMGGV